MVYTGRSPLRLYPYLWIWSRLSQPVSSNHTIWSVWKNCMSAINLALAIADLCRAICWIFFRENPCLRSMQHTVEREIRVPVISATSRHTSPRYRPGLSRSEPTSSNSGLLDSFLVLLLSGLVGSNSPVAWKRRSTLCTVPTATFKFCATFWYVRLIPIICQIMWWRRSMEYGALRPGSADLHTKRFEMEHAHKGSLELANVHRISRVRIIIRAHAITLTHTHVQTREKLTVAIPLGRNFFN